VEFNSFLDKFQNFITSFRNRNTAGKIGDVCAKTGFALFNNDGVFHGVILFQSCLFENTVQRPSRHVDVWFACDSHRSAFRCVFELTVAAFRASQMPAIVFKQSDEVSNLHALIIRASSDR
jgi:hypothetical protein